MKLRFLIGLGLLMISSAHAAPKMTPAQVLNLCENASPTPPPQGWQDFEYKAIGKVTQTSTGYAVRGTENGAPGTCIVTLGKKEAIFTFDNFKKVQDALDAKNAPYRFETQCDSAVIKLAAVPDKLQYSGNINLPYHKSGDIKKVQGGYTDTNDFFGEYYSCSGAIGAVRVKFINPDAPSFILKAFQAQRNAKSLAIIDSLPNVINAVSGYDSACQQDQQFALIRAQAPISSQAGQSIEPRWILAKGYGVDGASASVRRQIDSSVGEAGLHPTGPWNNYDGGFGRSYTSLSAPGFIYLVRLQDFPSGGTALCIAAQIPR